MVLSLIAHLNQRFEAFSDAGTRLSGALEILKSELLCELLTLGVFDLPSISEVTFIADENFDDAVICMLGD